MLKLLLTGLVTALSLLVVDLVVPGVNIATFPAALIAAASIGVVNSLIRPVLSVLSLPLNVLSFGLFSLVVNGLCFWLSSILVPGFAVGGPLAFILGPVILSLVSTFLGNYLGERYPMMQSTTTEVDS
ncbi:MAG: phage holin family protein [Leptolyngbyaceae cyanobacterium SM1_1_3]|nr:phage holin family protein [Leptolyngbyaceae cyanobacterium SM1_1_3]NJM84754.1 phage holin family protein [Leptolyngbyaceae cyanobacterium RM2_2_21]NJN01980.1 phage holin family protein [Leptolyngbyaceae cyanobacterium RM1_1_2]NJO10125.1 phage holin family protein [Leptolyngbyaceae cyanobacterium SL_1_1]